MDKDSRGNNQDIRKGAVRMKIGINATFLNEKPTGVCIFAREFCSALVRMHDDTLVFSPFEDCGIPKQCIRRVTRAAAGSTRLLNNMCRILYLNTVLPFACRSEHIDVLYCPITEFPFLPSVPMVVHIHDLHPIYFPEQFGLASRRLGFSLKHIHKAAKRITVSSHYVKSELLSRTGISEDAIDVVPLAYNNVVFRPQGSEDRTAFLNRYSVGGEYLLFVGSLYPYKNAGTLIEAFLKIKHKIPHKLVIIGRKSFAGGVLVDDPRIRYTDYVPEKDLISFYSHADVFVYPSITEGFGLSPLEAMACGTPVISSWGGSIPEVVGEGSMLFDPKDSVSLSELIVKVLEDRELRRDLVERGFRNVERFSWEQTASGIVNACKKAMMDA